MSEALQPDIERRRRRPWLVASTVGGAAMVVIGLGGALSAGWGYALFVLSALSLLAGVALLAVFALSRAGDTSTLQWSFARLFALGACLYVLSVGALAGYYAHEALAGRIAWTWMVFGPCALAALVVLDYGVYRKLVRNNLPTWRRYRAYIRREASDPAAMRRSLVDEVLLHRALFRASPLRWLRHTLIFWGFAAMFVTELVAVLVRDGFPAFGWRDVWREPGHPVRLAFEWAYDVTGAMIVAGCLLALAWRAAVNGRPERKYADTPTTLFLLAVAATGFVVEGLRIAAAPGSADATPVGRAMARLVEETGIAGAGVHASLWLVHAIGACLFIAYVPAMRMIHSCATPFGRLANSQKAMLAAKKRGIIAGMMRSGDSSPRAALSAGDESS